MNRWERIGIEVLLAAVIAYNAVEAIRAGDLFMRVITLVAVLGLTLLTGVRLGHHRAMMEWVAANEEMVAWMPQELTWHVDDDGVRHALCTLEDGTLRSIAMPAEINSPDAALRFIMDELRPDDE